MRHSFPVLLLCSACYTYAPVVAPGPAPGAHVSAGLTQDGTGAMLPLLGPDVAEVSGQVIAVSADTLRLSLASVNSQRGIPTSWRGEEVPLPRARLSFMTQRRLSPGGTVLLGAGITGGLYLLYRLLGGPGVFGASGGGAGRGGG
jgi:hypothetical protein